MRPLILLNSLTLGIPENEIKQIVNKYFPLDEFNYVLYPFIFKNEENIHLKFQKIIARLKDGAQPTETVRNIFIRAKIFEQL